MNVIRITAISLLSLLLFAGCAAQPGSQPVRRCPGKANLSESLKTLNERREKIISLRASGQCLLQYHADKKIRKENFPIKLWINPPYEIYLQGDVAFDATGLVFGSNADEFWFWLKPKEVSSYWYGKWSQAGNFSGLSTSPNLILEAFGRIDVNQQGWQFKHENNLDLLILRNKDGIINRKIYIEPCDYIVRKIELFDDSGDMSLKAEFTEYEKLEQGYLVPSKIKLNAYLESGQGDSAQITLSSIKPLNLNIEQRKRLFVRPPARGFNHIYKVIDGKPVEQGQH